MFYIYIYAFKKIILNNFVCIGEKDNLDEIFHLVAGWSAGMPKWIWYAMYISWKPPRSHLIILRNEAFLLPQYYFLAIDASPIEFIHLEASSKYRVVQMVSWIGWILPQRPTYHIYQRTQANIPFLRLRRQRMTNSNFSPEASLKDRGCVLVN